MGNKKRGVSKPPKPFLATAVFCEQVLLGKDQAMSAIRIVERVDVFTRDPDPEKRVPIRLWALVSFKSGDVKDERRLKLVLRMPTGKKKLFGEAQLPFQGDEIGVNHRIRIKLDLKTQGLYWLDVFVDRTRYTSMPLRVVINRGATIDHVEVRRAGAETSPERG